MDAADNINLRRFFVHAKVDAFENFKQGVELMPWIVSAHTKTDNEISVEWSYGSLGNITVLTISVTPLIIYCKAVDMILLHLPLQGETVAWYRYQRDAARAGKTLCIIRSEGGRREFSHYRGISLFIKGPKFRSEYEAWSGKAFPAGFDVGGLYDLGRPGTRAFATKLAGLVGQLESTPTSRLSKALCADYERNIIESLFFGPLREPLSNATGPIVEPSTRTIRVAVDFLWSHYSQPISMQTLADATGVSIRALQYAFKRHFGCSPWAYLKLCRLENVRVMLADRNNTMNVTEIAITCGFNHLSDFSTAYRKRFGETPRKSLLYGRSLPR